jgi:hypothetical protein
MSRKDYIQIAALLQQYKERLSVQEFNALVTDLAMLFQRDNPRFDASKFASAIYQRGRRQQREVA